VPETVQGYAQGLIGLPFFSKWEITK